MKKSIVTILAVALLLTMFCGQAMASFGGLTIKTAKVYSDPAMKIEEGTIPAYTALLVRSSDSFTDIYINGKIYYIDSSALLKKTIVGDYVAVLGTGTKVYQRATTESNSYKLKKSGYVQICKVKGGWALVQTLGARGLYAFVPVDSLKEITKI